MNITLEDFISPLYILPVRFPEVKGQEEGRAGRMLYPEATLPYSGCLLIHSDTRPSKALAGHRKHLAS